MDFNKITLIAAAKKRLEWLNQRQEVLAQNIANADTPSQKAHDLQSFDFQRLAQQEARQVNVAVTRKEHLAGRVKTMRDYAEDRARKPYETAPAGNAVILEEQMLKLNETQTDHRLMTELYRKQLAMFKMAVSKGQ